MTLTSAGSRTVASLLSSRASESPLALAFQQEVAEGRWEPINWQAFAGRVARLRQSLHAAGLRSGDRLALIAPVSLQWELLHHAALSIGVVVVGMDTHDLPDRIANMVSQASINAIATSAPQAIARVPAERLAACRVLLHLGDAATAPADGLPWRSWADLEAMPPAADVLPRPAAEDIATIIFTSGTTGAPKGIAYTHAQVCLAVDSICDAFAFAGEGSRLLCWLPLSNLFQRMVNLAAIRQGATTYLLADPRRVMQVVAQVAPDVFVGVPRFFEKLHAGLVDNIAALPPMQRRLVNWAWNVGRRVTALERQRIEVSAPLSWTHWMAEHLVLRRLRSVMGPRLRCMVTGSAPTPLRLLEEFHALGWLVLEAYGLSENVMPMAMNRTDDFRFGTVGRPLAANQITVDANGEIKVRGAGVFRSYLDDVSGTALDAEGFYSTGDIGAIDPDGYLRLTGRSGDLIKTSTGRRVAPAVVEAVLRSVPGVDQAMLVGSGRKCLAALCACAAEHTDSDSLQSLEHALRARIAALAEHDRPMAIALIPRPFSIDADELTPNLKLRRDTVAKKYAQLIDDLYRAVDDRSNARAGTLFLRAGSA